MLRCSTHTRNMWLIISLNQALTARGLSNCTMLLRLLIHRSLSFVFHNAEQRACTAQQSQDWPKAQCSIRLIYGFTVAGRCITTTSTLPHAPPLMMVPFAAFSISRLLFTSGRKPSSTRPHSSKKMLQQQRPVCAPSPC